MSADPGAEPETETEQGEPAGADVRLSGDRLREMVEAEARRAEEAEEEEAAKVGGRPAGDADAALARFAALGIEPITRENLEALGPIAEGLAPCPFCSGHGAVDPDTLLAALPRVVEELAPFPQASTFYRCAECDGWGRVLTGARLGSTGVQPCPICDGNGYRDKRTDDELARQRVAISRVETLPGVTENGSDPLTTPPPEGTAPAPGMAWDETLHRWAYPPAVPVG